MRRAARRRKPELWPGAALLQPGLASRSAVHLHHYWRSAMAALPVRRGGQGLTVLNPSREFEDIYNRMGQLMNLAIGDFSMLQTTDMPWSPLAAFPETDDASLIQAELPRLHQEQVRV